MNVFYQLKNFDEWNFTETEYPEWVTLFAGYVDMPVFILEPGKIYTVKARFLHPTWDHSENSKYFLHSYEELPDFNLSDTLDDIKLVHDNKRLKLRLVHVDDYTNI